MKCVAFNTYKWIALNRCAPSVSNCADEAPDPSLGMLGPAPSSACDFAAAFSGCCALTSPSSPTGSAGFNVGVLSAADAALAEICCWAVGGSSASRQASSRLRPSSGLPASAAAAGAGKPRDAWALSRSPLSWRRRSATCTHSNCKIYMCTWTTSL